MREKDPRELAARALCDHRGLPPDLRFRGGPMWMSVLAEVDVVLAAVGFDSKAVTGAGSRDKDEDNS